MLLTLNNSKLKINNLSATFGSNVSQSFKAVPREYTSSETQGLLALFLTKRVPEVVEIRPGDWPETFCKFTIYRQSAERFSTASGTRLVRKSAHGLFRP